MKIATIVLNYNTSSDCQKCVGFLQKQEDIEQEIIIVDNCSCDKERLAVEQLCSDKGCILIFNKENQGYNAGNNIGLRYAASMEYRYAMVTNPDMEFPQQDYIIQLIAQLENDNSIVICSSDIISAEGEHINPQREVSYLEELFWLITTFRNRKAKMWCHENYKKSTFCEKIAGCCFIIRIDFLKEIGFFDENIFLYSEEAILAKTVKNNNKKIYYLATVYAIHRHIEKEKGNSIKRIETSFRSRKYYLQNYSGYRGLKLCLLLFSKQIQKLHHLVSYKLKK